MAEKEQIYKALDRFVKHVTSRAKANLTNKDRNVSRRLYDSIKGEITINSERTTVKFFMEKYGDYQDQGVKGKNSSAKAPNSPFKFGSGRGKQGGLTKAIEKWVEARRFQFRQIDPKTKKSTGKFMSYRATAWVITRSIYSKGLKPTLFFTKPYQAALKNLPDELAQEYGLEVKKLFKESIKK
jgi:hypothetical protein